MVGMGVEEAGGDVRSVVVSARFERCGVVRVVSVSGAGNATRG